MSERELIKDVIAKNIQGEIKAEFIRNKGQKCVDLDEAIEINRDCMRYVNVKTEVNVARNEAKKKRDQQGDKEKSKSGDENICRKHKTHKWSECPDNKNSPNYTGNKRKKKSLEEKSIKNKNKGEKTSSKAKKNEAYVTEHKINQDSSPEQRKDVTFECDFIKDMMESCDELKSVTEKMTLKSSC